jgi:hypothetical protein
MSTEEKVIQEARRLNEAGRTEDAKRLLQEYERTTAVERTNEQTVYDLLPTAGEIIPSLLAAGPGAKAGAAAGAPLGPLGVAAGGLIGGVASSALAAGTGRFIGEAAEDYFEGRVVDPEKALQKATEAATQDAIWSTIFGLGFPVLSKGAQKVGQEVSKKFSGKYTTDEAIETVADLQEKLKEYGATLMPTMVSGGKRNEILFDVAKVSLVTKNTVDEVFKNYEKYMGAQTEQLVSSFKAGTPRQHGENLLALRQATDSALQEIVSPFYKAISQEGKKIPVDITKSVKEQVKEIRARHRGKPKKDPQTGKTVFQINWPDSATRNAHMYLTNIPEKLSFQEAHTNLSVVKQRLFELSKSTDSSKAAAKIYEDTINILETQMDEAAESLSPVIKQQYDEVTRTYRNGRKVIDATYLKKAMDSLDPATIGGMLTQDGLSVGLEQVKNLKKLAKEYQERLPKDSPAAQALGSQEDVLEGIRRGYLESLFKIEGQGGTSSLRTVREKLKDPKFALTFNEVFKETPAVRKKIDKMIEELSILERASGSEAAFSLSLRGQELGAIRGAVSSPVNTLEQVLKFVPALMAKKAITAESIDKQIGLIKTATAYQNRGKQIPREYWSSWAKLVPKGVVIGTGVSAVGTAGSALLTSE